MKEELVTVKLIKESSGLGYGRAVANWMIAEEENIVAIKDLAAFKEVTIPLNIARNFQNLVNIETGEIVSKVFELRGTNPTKVLNDYKRVPKTISKSKKIRFSSAEEVQEETLDVEDSTIE